jgi:3-phosphoshikimate 1-carboxyvinyltransferase
LQGAELDLNDIPDALPILAVLGCFAQGKTVLKNVAQARLKETDRIMVMAKELTRLGAKVEEHEDGLTVYQSRLHGGQCHGHHDHRVIMALAVAGLGIADGQVQIDTAEAMDVTFPNFVPKFLEIGADINIEQK